MPRPETCPLGRGRVEACKGQGQGLVWRPFVEALHFADGETGHTSQWFTPIRGQIGTLSDAPPALLEGVRPTRQRFSTQAALGALYTHPSQRF